MSTELSALSYANRKLLSFSFDFGKDDVDIGRSEILVEQFNVATQLGQLSAVHQRHCCSSTATERTK